nr:HipA N-terminal domain-containing protein [Pseudoalteromonas sp. SR41-4]
MNNRSLDVYAGKQLMGQLQDSNGFWSFKYDQAWLNSANKFAITPSIQLQEHVILDSGTTRPVQQFFDNLLPEENARELLAKEVRVDHEDSFALLTASGIESAGALTLLPEHIDFPAPSAIPLAFSELSSRIKNLPRALLNSRQSSRMSLAGPQHKMLVIKLGDELFEGNEGTPSTHILKPDHSEPDQYWQTTCNEWFMMKLAGRLGLDVPNVELIYTPSQPI